MRLSFGQEMRMAQKQILAPRMIQSMEILQLPILALQERIDQELEENPVLARAEDEDENENAGPSDDPVEQQHPDAPTENERELVVDESNDNEQDFERLVKLAEEWPDQFEERSRPSSGRIDEEGDRKHDAMANMAQRPQSLHDYLRGQLGWFELAPELRKMAERVIYALDSNGYLPAPVEELLDPNADQAQRDLATEALALVQKLDPLGVGAQHLRECLLLQLTPGTPMHDELYTLIDHHLEDLEHNRLPLISRKTGYSIEHIQEVLTELRKLNPKPGAIHSDTHVPNVTPDVFIEPNDEGHYDVRLEDGSTPSLRISKFSRDVLLDPNARTETKEYIKKKLNAAQWLIDSIDQRRNTLSRVAQAIVDHQTEFLNQGPEAIEPLKMQQIADKVGVHVTTVSRAVDDKWVQTPRGIFPLKRFFVGGTTSADGEEIAWDAVRLKLQEVVDGEDKSHPFSDDGLVEELAKHGVTVARRTVTKYRKALNIPSSRQRRDWTLADDEKKSTADSAE
jgi:RNA polymerase sigma-54 factor